MAALELKQLLRRQGQTLAIFQVQGLMQTLDDEGRLRTLHQELRISALEAAPDHGEPEVAVYTYDPSGRRLKFLLVRRGIADLIWALREVLPHHPVAVERAIRALEAAHQEVA